MLQTDECYNTSYKTIILYSFFYFAFFNPKNQKNCDLEGLAFKVLVTMAFVETLQNDITAPSQKLPSPQPVRKI